MQNASAGENACLLDVREILFEDENRIDRCAEEAGEIQCVLEKCVIVAA